MKIYVDADGSPVVNIAVDVARDYELEIIIVKNYAHQIYSDYAEVISVDISNDSADFYIVNHLNKKDIVVTQDYGLAALCLSKGAYVINQSGFMFTEKNIDGMLNRRYIHRVLRDQGKNHSNPKKRKPSEDIKFENKFIELIENVISFKNNIS